MIRSKITTALLTGLLLSFFACDSYLDIVPDKTQQIDLLFERKEAAYTALSTCYHYLPQNDAVYSTYVFASDEVTTPNQQETPGVELMRGKQSATNPIMGLWSGHYAHGKSQESVFMGIRDCNILIDNIDQVIDMGEEEKATWKAEASFLKAYYHFLLLRQYGPVPIIDKNLPISADVEQVRVSRKPVDEVFEYIVTTIDAAMEDLPVRITANNDLGRIDQVIAAAIKSRVLITAASPLYNGNSEFYETFTNKSGEKYFNTQYDSEKWKLALDATQEAIDLATQNGVGIYTYTAAVPSYDSTDYQSEEVKSLYNYRMMFTDKWNQELIWGNSSPVNGDWWTIQAASMMINPDASASEASWQWVSPTIRMAELFYTSNGLPIDQDLSWNYDRRYAPGIIPPDESLHAQAGEVTANLHLKREARFYASIGFDRGINRTWGQKWELQMRKGEDHGRLANTYDYAITGYVLKKVCHMASEAETYNKLVVYPWPIIRMAELYLNLAEASNEYYGPGDAVYSALNTVRTRSGVSDVELVWADASLCKTPGKHLEKSGLAEIIKQERSIELSFEGERYYDIRRWKMGQHYFNNPVRGWSVDESDINKFYTIIDVGQRSFIAPRDYLHPINTNELVINPNLDQNPGW